MDLIGLVGAGVMGRAITPRILEAGYTVLAYDPLPEAQERVKGLGATVAPDLVTVARRAEMIIMFLPGPNQVQACVSGPEGLLSAAKQGSVIVDMSTVDPGTSQRMSELANRCGVAYLDAPVLGRPVAVGHWALPIGGAAKDIERCTPVLQLFAAKLFHIGGPGSGNKVKLRASGTVTPQSCGRVSKQCGQNNQTKVQTQRYF